LNRHRDLCTQNAASAVISVNVIWSTASELKTILDSFINRGVTVAAVIMGTEVDNDVDAVFFPAGATDYNLKIDPFLDMMRNSANSLYEAAFATIPIAVNAAGTTGSNYASWNTSVSSHMVTAYNLPKAGAINWWWYPALCANAMSDPKTCMDQYFNDSLPNRINGFKAFYDQMYVSQYGIKSDTSFDYSNTFISGYFPVKELFWMIDYNAVNGEFFKGAYFMKLASSSSYDPIWDDPKTPSIETKLSVANDFFSLSKEITGRKYLHTSFTSLNGKPVHAEPFFFYDAATNSGKLYVMNSSGLPDTLSKIYFDCLQATGAITIRTISAAGLLTAKVNIPALTTTTQTSAIGQYTVVLPGYSIVVIDFTTPVSNVTATATPATICQGSSSTLTATGAISYAWSPSTGLSSISGATVNATPASTITYTMTATDITGCNILRGVVVSVSSFPALAITGNNSICSGQSTTFDAGAGYSSYLWSNGATTKTITLSTAGTYTVTVTNSNGCSGTSSRALTINATSTVTVSPTSSSICPGNNVSLTASGASTYAWSPSTGLSATTGATVTATPSATTTYTVTGTNSSGCTSTATVTVTVSCTLPSNLSTTGITKNSATTNWTIVSCAIGYKVNYKKQSASTWTEKTVSSNKGTLKLSSLSSSTVYEWKVATKCPDGNYGAFSNSLTFTTLAQRMSDERNDEISNESFSIVPNPTTGQMTIELQTSENVNGSAEIFIINILGEAIFSEKAIINDGILNQVIRMREDNPPGLYLVKVMVNDKIYLAKVIYQK
ncbi:MAG: T9SS type A sorting domain-containing protein, partial [Chitinophagales bacterium]|nr:T9SS type A sorting domain-containing protein [Chitinophagales bacterium]